MFKKFIVSSIAFCLLSVQVNAATHNNLKAAFDELNYALSVEWDQQDRSFYNQAQEKFALNLKDLQQKGLSSQELVEFALAEVKDEKLSQELRTGLTMVMINKMSQKEAHKYLTDILNKSYSQGASWSGGATIASVVVLVLIVAVALVVAGEARVEDGCYEVRQCEDYCSGGVCVEDCDWECL